MDLCSLLVLLRHQHPASAEEIPMKNRLRVLRAERGWSQAELADRLEVSRQSVNAIETGKYDPSLPLAFRLARLFAMRIEDIFTDEA
jgi:putative transcriptional regulator